MMEILQMARGDVEQDPLTPITDAPAQHWLCSIHVVCIA